MQKEWQLGGAVSSIPGTGSPLSLRRHVQTTFGPHVFSVLG
jgi:hypothetical protein